MLQDKEKKVEVKVKRGENEEMVTIVVRKPNNALLSSSQRVGAKAWTDCVRDGIMTKKELEKFMKEQDIWNDGKDEEQKKIVKEISDLEKQLFISGSHKDGKLRASEGKRIAIQMRLKRAELRDLIAERMGLEQNTAESISDNAKFDFLVANCTFYENGHKVYKDLDDYKDNADDEIGFTAAATLASMLYAVDKDFEAKLPENKFLKMFKFVDDNLSLVNQDGDTVDLEGRRIDKNGYYVNDKGQRTDKDGNPLDESGNYVPTVEYVNDVETKKEEDKAKEEEENQPKKRSKSTVS